MPRLAMPYVDRSPPDAFSSETSKKHSRPPSRWPGVLSIISLLGTCTGAVTVYVWEQPVHQEVRALRTEAAMRVTEFEAHQQADRLQRQALESKLATLDATLLALKLKIGQTPVPEDVQRQLREAKDLLTETQKTLAEPKKQLTESQQFLGDAKALLSKSNQQLSTSQGLLTESKQQRSEAERQREEARKLVVEAKKELVEQKELPGEVRALAKRTEFVEKSKTTHDEQIAKTNIDIENLRKTTKTHDIMIKSMIEVINAK